MRESHKEKLPIWGTIGELRAIKRLEDEHDDEKSSQK